MRTRILLTTLLVLILAVPALGFAEDDADYEVTLPAGYDTDGLNYPVIYVLPQDGFIPDDSGLRRASRSHRRRRSAG